MEPGRSPAPIPLGPGGPPRPPKRRKRVVLIVLVVVFVVLGLCAGVFAAFAYLPRLMMRPYDVRTAPPAITASWPPPEGLLTADERADLRESFEEGDFEALNRALDELQRASEGDPSLDRKVCTAFDLFTRYSDRARIDEWLAFDPDAYAPHLARACYFNERAWDARGTAWASETSEEQFESMGEFFDLAIGEVDEALARNPRLVRAHLIRVGVYNAFGDDAEETAAREEASATFPASCYLRLCLAHHLEPRWGGSYEQMERYAQDGIAANPGDPQFYLVLGSVYRDQADVFARAGRKGDAFELYAKALSYGEQAGILQERAALYYDSRRYDEALTDVDRSLELNPDSEDALLMRANVLLAKGDTDGALADVAHLDELSPNDPDINEWKSWASMRYEVSIP